MWSLHYLATFDLTKRVFKPESWKYKCPGLLALINEVMALPGEHFLFAEGPDGAGSHYALIKVHIEGWTLYIINSFELPQGAHI